MTDKNIAAFVLLFLFCATGVTIAMLTVWFDHRTRTRALDVLRVYAERGEEPPASVTQALSRVSGWPKVLPPVDDTKDRIGRPRTRGGFLAHAAANTVFAGGFSWFAWWRYADLGEASTGVIVSILVAMFFAASVAAQLVGAYYAAPSR
jgi:hypothetical protein